MSGEREDEGTKDGETTRRQREIRRALWAAQAGARLRAKHGLGGEDGGRIALAIAEQGSADDLIFILKDGDRGDGLGAEPALAYAIAQTERNGEAWKNIYDDAEARALAARIWEVIVRRAVAEREDGEITPLLHAVLSEAAEAAERMAFAGYTGIGGMGEGLESAMQQAKNWIRERRHLERAATLARDARARYLWTEIAAHSPAINTVVSKDGDMWNAFAAYPDLAAANTHASAATLRQLALNNVQALISLGEPDTAAKALEILEEREALGKHEIHEAARIMKHAFFSDPKGGVTMEMRVARQRCLARHGEIQEIILAPREKPINADERYILGLALLANSQGQEWTRLAQDLLGEHPGGQADHYLLEALENTEPWNTQGLSRKDILFLVASPDKDVRKAGMRISAMIRETPREAAPEKPAQGLKRV